MVKARAARLTEQVVLFIDQIYVKRQEVKEIS